jgi:glycosyltransferase involved in cell wall biosynthesis
VLQVITSLVGGAGLYAYQLTRCLDPARFDVTLAFGPGYPLDAVVASEGLAHRKLRWTRRLNPLATLEGAWDLWAVLRREPFDIVHTHCSLGGAVGRVLARCAGVPHILFTIHAFASRGYQPLWRRQLFLVVERFLDACTDGYLASTQVMKDLVIAKRIARAERIEVVPLGIELPAVPDAADRGRARAALGLSDGELAVAVAGRLEQQKGVTYLLRAFSRVHRVMPHVRLLVFGDGPLAAELRDEARRFGVAPAVHFLGWRSDLEALLPGCDVLCLPSLWEAFGYVLLEAMAAMVPIVATRVEGIPEVTGNGECALLVPAADDAALAGALRDLLEDAGRRRLLAQRGRQRVERQYTLAQMIRRLEAFYERLVDGST